MSRLRLTLVSAAALAWTATAFAEDAFYSVPIQNLKIIEGKLPGAVETPSFRWSRFELLYPYGVLDGEGEIYITTSGSQWDRFTRSNVPSELGGVLIRVPGGPKEIRGRLFLPKSDWRGMVMVRFTLPTGPAADEARSAFFRAKEDYYQRLLNRGFPGSAWFRHQLREARAAQGAKPVAEPSGRAGATMPRYELERSYELFSGGRAVSENLQLDRELPRVTSKEGTVKIDSLAGITVREIDWEPLVKGLKPELDPLAAYVPLDQHVVFFPSFKAAQRVADESGSQGVPILRMAGPWAEDAQTEEQYQKQLCLSMSGLARLLGPHLARSMALTGSDTYFPTGTDVAVLFEAPGPEILVNLLLAQVRLVAAKQGEAKAADGQIDGVAYHGVCSPDRRVSSYIARLGHVVVATNSLAQLERLVAVQKGKAKSIATLPEYRFFRNRYRRGDPQETALVFLSDATIRRWCGPRWRIANSRRTCDAAALAELQASQMDKLARQKVEPGPLHTDLPIAAAGELRLTAAGVSSAGLGSLAFLTPIAEMPLAEVTKTEADAYNRWRDGYQSNWNWAFDPIALRIGLRDEKLAADLTVMPLIWQTNYREFISVTQGGQFAPDAGDPHGAALHLIFALGPKSFVRQMGENFVSTMGKGATLGWIGSSLTIYAEEDPFWAQLAKQPEAKRGEFLEKEFPRLPVVLQVDVASGLRLAAFLAGLRAFAEQSAPGMVAWESLSYRDQPYVKVKPTERARSPRGPDIEKTALYYAASGEALIVTLREDLLKRALDRQIARHNAQADGKTASATAGPDKSQGGKASAPIRQWLGSNVGLQVDRKVLEVLAAVTRDDFQHAMQLRAWGNLPILNEWKRRYPTQDPVELHRRIWHTELVCPGGGKYVWNEKWQTMESTVYGQPGDPKAGPAAPPVLSAFARGNFGLTFENQGLRARVEMDRSPRPKP